MLWYSNYCYWCLLLLYNCGIKILPMIFLNRFFSERNFLIEKMCKFNEKFKFWPFCSFKQNFYHRGRNKISESIYILKLSTEHQCLRKGQLYLLYINKSTLSLFVNLMWNQCLSIRWAMSDLPRLYFAFYTFENIAIRSMKNFTCPFLSDNIYQRMWMNYAANMSLVEWIREMEY